MKPSIPISTQPTSGSKICPGTVTSASAHVVGRFSCRRTRSTFTGRTEHATSPPKPTVSPSLFAAKATSCTPVSLEPGASTNTYGHSVPVSVTTEQREDGQEDGVETRGLTFSPSGLRRVVRNIRDAIYKDGILFSVHLSGNKVTLVGAEPYSTAQDSITGAGIPVVSRDTTAGVDLPALTALADFLGTIKDLKTQPGSVLLTAGKRRLIWTDEATGETLETPTGEPHPGTQTASNLSTILFPARWATTVSTLAPNGLYGCRKQMVGK